MAVANPLKVFADIERGGKPCDEAVNGDGGTDVLDNVALRPDVCQTREPEHVEHDEREVLTQPPLSPLDLVPFARQPFKPAAKPFDVRACVHGRDVEERG